MTYFILWFNQFPVQISIQNFSKIHTDLTLHFEKNQHNLRDEQESLENFSKSLFWCIGKQTFPFGPLFYYAVIYTVNLSLLIKMSILFISPVIKLIDVTFLGMFCFKKIFRLLNIILCKVHKIKYQRKMGAKFVVM